MPTFAGEAVTSVTVLACTEVAAECVMTLCIHIAKMR